MKSPTTVLVPRAMIGEENTESFTAMMGLEDAETGYTGPVIRYLWFRHATRHEDFVSGYFEKGNEHSLNIRSQTAHLADVWKPHNEAISQAMRNGDILWRVKAYNSIMHTVDHIEVWKDAETIDRYFRFTRALDNGTIWTEDQRLALSHGLYDCGIRAFVTDGQAVSLTERRSAYVHFSNRANQKDACIVETNYRE